MAIMQLVLAGGGKLARYMLGGNIVKDVGGYRIHIFTDVGSLTVPDGDPFTGVEYLLVGGGGSSGGCNSQFVGQFCEVQGGGGGGGVLNGTMTFNPGNYIVEVGAGGAIFSTITGYGFQGSDTKFMGLTAKGGGGGGGGPGGAAYAGGGSGGGGSGLGAGGAGTAGQGYEGGKGFYFPGNQQIGTHYSGGGGGGAGSQGGFNPNSITCGNAPGGIGKTLSISGSSAAYGAGAGGSVKTTGAANTGNGGTTGGYGVVIVRYAI
jgi:hypothetical protein